MTRMQIPMYPTGRPFKDVIAGWNGKSLIVNNVPSDIYSQRSKTLTASQKALYNAMQMKWYFADIGFESDEEFIYRLNGVWNMYIDQYDKLYEIASGELGAETETHLSNDKESGTRTVTNTGTRTEKETGSRSYQDSQVHTGTNGVKTVYSGEDTTAHESTTSDKKNTTENMDRLTRATPNEQTEYTGEDTASGTASGSDTVTYGKTLAVTETPNEKHVIERIETPNVTRTITPNVTQTESPDIDHARNEEVSRTYRTADEVGKIQRLKNVLESFAMLFENLFSEVLF